MGKHLWEDSRRVVPLFILGYIFIQFSPDFAQWVNEPAFSAWGFVIGGTLVLIGLSHIVRRLLFPQLDLAKVGGIAITSPIGAGLVFFAVCYLLSTIIQVMSIAIQLK